MKKIVKRAAAPTPKFFKVLRTIGLTLAAAGATVLTSPILLPAAVLSLGGYLAVAGGVITAVSQLSVRNDSE
ncbi:hypothetical protein [Flavobacterium tegetincola]|uniref:hypothetical protein n=1 Tax=Flavobacterium tegetincola TaxID=150172 RepID=UPI00042998AE|nr:hypothetical protein [Flavobacterium tegetincola]